MADQDAERDRDEDLDVEDLVPRLMPGGGTDCFCGHGRLALGMTKLAAPSWERASRPTTKIPVFMAASEIFSPRCTAICAGTAIELGARAFFMVSQFLLPG